MSGGRRPAPAGPAAGPARPPTPLGPGAAARLARAPSPPAPASAPAAIWEQLGPACRAEVLALLAQWAVRAVAARPAPAIREDSHGCALEQR